MNFSVHPFDRKLNLKEAKALLRDKFGVKDSEIPAARWAVINLGVYTGDMGIYTICSYTQECYICAMHNYSYICMCTLCICMCVYTYMMYSCVRMCLYIHVLDAYSGMFPVTHSHTLHPFSVSTT